MPTNYPDQGFLTFFVPWTPSTVWWNLQIPSQKTVFNSLLACLLADLVHWAESFLRSQPVPSWSRNYPDFMEPECLLAFTSARHLSLSWARSIQSMPSSHFVKLLFNIILQFTPGSSKWSLSLRFPYQNPVCTVPILFVILAACLAHLILDLITRIICGDFIIISVREHPVFNNQIFWCGIVYYSNAIIITILM